MGEIGSQVMQWQCLKARTNGAELVEQFAHFGVGCQQLLDARFLVGG